MPMLVAALPYIATVAAVAGTAVSVQSAVEAGKSQQKAANYQAEVLNRQALEAKQQAGLAVAAQQSRANQIMASIRASAAASGVDVSSGSPLQDIKTNTQQEQINEMYTKYAGNLSASGLQSQGALTLWGGNRAREAGYLTGAGSLISGVGNIGTFALTHKTELGIG